MTIRRGLIHLSSSPKTVTSRDLFAGGYSQRAVSSALRYTSWLFLSLILVLCSGCGFTLRGTMIDVNWLSPVALVAQTNIHHDLLPILKDKLEIYRINITPNATQARYLILIEKDTVQKNMVSVSASTTPRQYQLIYSVIYTVLPLKGAPILSSNAVTVTRQYTINNERILGSDFEEATIIREMQKDAATQIISRIARHRPLIPIV